MMVDRKAVLKVQMMEEMMVDKKELKKVDR
jgi:hypothetical protein